MCLHRGSVELRDRYLEQHLALTKLLDRDRVHLGDAVLVPEDQARIPGMTAVDEDVLRTDEDDVRNLGIADRHSSDRAIQLHETALPGLNDERGRGTAQVIVVGGRRGRRVRRRRFSRVHGLSGIDDALLGRYWRGTIVGIGAQRARGW